MFLDIAFGIFAAGSIGTIFNIDLTLSLCLIGVLFTLLPDIDVLWYSTEKGDHRGFMHWPVLYIGMSLLLYFYGNTPFASLFLITTLFHFVHDTFILGWGIAWLAPFSYRRYKLFPDDGKGGFLKERYVTWLPGEQKALQEKLDDKHWIRNWYGKVTVVSVLEYTSFLVALVYAYTHIIW